MSFKKAEIWPILEKIKLPLRLQLGSNQTVNVQRDIRTDQWGNLRRGVGRNDAADAVPR